MSETSCSPERPPKSTAIFKREGLFDVILRVSCSVV
jgi:hypothetical protein